MWIYCLANGVGHTSCNFSKFFYYPADVDSFTFIIIYYDNNVLSPSKGVAENSKRIRAKEYIRILYKYVSSIFEPFLLP